VKIPDVRGRQNWEATKMSTRIDETYYADPNSFGARMRAGRFGLVKDIIASMRRRQASCRILDIGGTSSYWLPFQTYLNDFNINVVVLNLSSCDKTQDGISFVQGDARKINFPDNSFDLVHSNSVIEHVGRWTDMQDMANEVSRLAPNYFVQVPYFWFPLEPHFRIPYFHWLPEQVRARILMRVRAGFFPKAKDFGEAMRFVQDSQLLDRTQLRTLFPDAQVLNERVFGLTKSLMAVRRADEQVGE
jgi:Methyltransferase domain